MFMIPTTGMGALTLTPIAIVMFLLKLTTEPAPPATVPDTQLPAVFHDSLLPVGFHVPLICACADGCAKARQIPAASAANFAE